MSADVFQTLLIVVIALALLGGAVVLRVLAIFHEEAVQRHNLARQVARLRARHRRHTRSDPEDPDEQIVV